MAAPGEFELVDVTALDCEGDLLVAFHKPDHLLLDLALSDSSGIVVTCKVK